MLFKEAIEKFNAWQSFGKRQSTRATYRLNMLQFAMYMRNCAIEMVTLDDIIGYLQGMRDLGFNENNFMVKSISIKKFFEFFGKLHITRIDPELIPIIEGEYKFPKVADAADYQKLLNSIPVNNDPRHVRNKTMLMLYKDTGMRLNECISLDIKDVDTQKMTAMIKTEKTKKLHPIRRIFWTEQTNEQMKLWIAKRGTLLSKDDALFISACGPKVGLRITGAGVTEMLRRYSHLAGLGYVLNTHSLRHLFGRTLAEQGAQDSSIATMMGHAHVDSSRPYTIMAGNKMAEFYDKYMRKPQ